MISDFYHVPLFSFVFLHGRCFWVFVGFYSLKQNIFQVTTIMQQHRNSLGDLLTAWSLNYFHSVQMYYFAVGCNLEFIFVVPVVRRLQPGKQGWRVRSWCTVNRFHSIPVGRYCTVSPRCNHLHFFVSGDEFSFFTSFLLLPRDNCVSYF